MRRSKELYEDALASLPNPDPPREFQGNALPKYTKITKINITLILIFDSFHSKQIVPH